MPPVPAKTFDDQFQIEEAYVCNEALGRIAAPLILDTEENSQQANLAREIFASSRKEIIRSGLFRFSSLLYYAPQDEDFMLPTNTKFSGAYKADGVVAFTGTNDTTDEIVVADVAVGETDPIEFLKPGMVVYGTYVPSDARVSGIDIDTRVVTLDRNTTDENTSFTARVPILRLQRIMEDESEMFSLEGSGANQRILALSGDTYISVRAMIDIVNPDLFDPLFRAALIVRLAAKFAMPLTKKPQYVSQMNSEYEYLLQKAQAVVRKEHREADSDRYDSDTSREGL